MSLPSNNNYSIMLSFYSEARTCKIPKKLLKSQFFKPLLEAILFSRSDNKTGMHFKRHILYQITISNYKHTLWKSYLCFKILSFTMYLRYCRKIMRHCCSQVSTSAVTNNHNTRNVHTMGCAGVQETYCNIIAVVELSGINVSRSLSVTADKIQITLMKVNLE